MIFLSAYLIAKRWDLPLVLDYRDEWTIHPPGWISASPFDRVWERKILRFASAVIFVTELMRERCLATNPSISPDRCRVVPNGWEPEDFRQARRRPAWHASDRSRRFVISFVGSSVPYTDPSSFFDRFEEVMVRRPSLRDRLKLRFVGRKIGDFRDHLERARVRLPDSIELIDEVKKTAAVTEMQDADALLFLLDPFYDHAIPGKLYEYLAAGPPVLVFGDTGMAADLVRRLGAGPVVPVEDPTALEVAFDRLMQEPRINWETPQRMSWIKQHTRSALALQMLSVLDGLRQPAAG
jgi:glycosyltransferase involved in cell wall biosynthesis